MALKAVLYHTKNCPRCMVTNNQLKPYMQTQQILIDRDQHFRMDIINYMDANGFRSAPLVRIFDGDRQLDEWNGFQVKKIKHWQEYVKAHE